MISRREAIETIALGGASMTFSGMAEVQAQTPSSASVPAAFAGQHKTKPLPFDPAKLKGISEKLIKSHLRAESSGSVARLSRDCFRKGRAFRQDCAAGCFSEASAFRTFA